MRGDAQNIDMTTKIVDRVLDGVSGIGAVTFTGGEPTLNVPIIKYFTEQVRKRKIDVSSFFIVTNGKSAPIEFLHALVDLYDVCGEPESCVLVMSKDRYHEPVKVPKIYSALKFFNPDGHGPHDEDSVVMEGRALDNGIGYTDPRYDSWEIDDFGEDYLSIHNNLHIGANGNVMIGCDFSFEREDIECIGNVIRETLKRILSRSIKRYRRAA
jgi:hypothetical protein